jgi:hypothetical protein
MHYKYLEKTGLDLVSHADKKILEMEKKFDLLQYQISDWCIWPIFRHWIARNIAGSTAKLETPRSRLGVSLCAAIISTPALLFVKHHEYFIKTYTSARAEKKAGLYIDIYFDRLFPRINSYFKIEAINNSKLIYRSVYAKYRSHVYTSIIELYIESLKILDRTVERYTDLARLFSNIFKQELLIEIPANTLAEKVANFIWYMKAYGYLLDKIRPEWILTADPGDYPLYAAARDRNIKTVEFCHGFINQMHPAYSWNDYALSFQQNIPIPDKILVYNDYLRKELQTRKFWGERIISVGSLRLDEYRKQDFIKFRNDRCVLIFTTEGNFIESSIQFINSFLSITRKNQLPILMIIRMHPVYDRDIRVYKKGFSEYKNIVTIYEGNSEMSTFELIARSHLHMSISSSCHYEALGLGVPTIVLKIGTWNRAMELLESGHGILVSTPIELFNVVKEYRHHIVDPSTKEYYFKPDAVENIIHELM